MTPVWRALAACPLLVLFAGGASPKLAFRAWARRWVGKKVYLVALPSGYWEWSVDGGREVDGLPRQLPKRYFGSAGTVQSIFPEPRSGTSPAINALGETVAHALAGTDVRVTVRFADGTVASTRTYPNLVAGELLLASKQKADWRKIGPVLPRLAGRRIYASAISTLYLGSSSLTDLASSYLSDPDGVEVGTSGYARRVGSFRLGKILLRPLTIKKAKYFKRFDMVVMEVALPGGGAALCVGGNTGRSKLCIGCYLSGRSPSTLRRILTASALLASIPSNLSASEIGAIRDGSVVRGMSEEAVILAWGWPKDLNDWGRAGKQLVYPGGAFVYLNRAGRVAEIQQLGG